MSAVRDRLLLVGFPILPAVSQTAADMWRLATGSDPTGFNSGPGNSAANGVINRLNYQLQVQPNRVDLFVNQVDNAAFSVSPPGFTSHKIAYDEAIAFMVSALSLRTDIQRLALVAEASETVPNSQTAAAKVAQLISGLPHPAGATDLYYQCTVDRDSRAVPGLKLAELGRWNSGRFLFIGMPPSAQAFPSQVEQHTVNHMADVSNRPRAQAPILMPNEHASILAELRERADDILDRGLPALS